MKDDQRSRLIGNIVDHLGKAARRIQYRKAALFCKAEADLGEVVAGGLGLDMDEVKRIAEMSDERMAEATKEGTFS